MKRILTVIALLLAAGAFNAATAQVAVNADGTAPDNSAMLDVKSTTKGVLIPRMTISQRDGITAPATGLMVFCTDNGQYYYNAGAPASKNWVMMNSQWLTNGTSIYYNNGNAGIGLSNPAYRLEVRNAALGGTAGNTMPWFRVSGPASNNDQIRIFHNRFADGADWRTSEIRLQRTVDATDLHFIAFRGTGSALGNLVFGFQNAEQMTLQSDGKIGIGTSAPTSLLEVEGDLKLQNGTAVNKFSTDGALSANSDLYVPTEKAVKSYISGASWLSRNVSSDPVPVSCAGVGSSDRMCIQGNFAYILSGEGLKIFDISNPAGMTPRGSSNTNLSNPTAVVVRGNYAYVTSSGNGRLCIFDISNPDNIVARDYATDQLTNPQDVALSGNYAYVTSLSNSTLCIFNVSNPDNIVFMSCKSSGISGPKQVTVYNNIAYVNCSLALNALNVSDPNNILPYATAATMGYGPLFISGNYLYRIDQGDLDLLIYDFNLNHIGDYGVGYANSLFVKDNTAYTTDGLYILRIYDVSDPQHISYIGSATQNINEPSCVWVTDQYIFVINNFSGQLCSYYRFSDNSLIGLNSDGSLKSFPVTWDQFGRNISNNNLGNVGIGTATPKNTLDVEGGLAVGELYAGYARAPSNGAIIEGYVGIGTSNPQNRLDVEGGLAVGAGYSGFYLAPANGAIIEGHMGIGTANPKGELSAGIYKGGTEGSTVSSMTHQLVLGGDYNEDANRNGVKLWIGDYDNDGEPVYPIYCEDENNGVDFYIKNRTSATGDPLMYFAGKVAINTGTTPSELLDVNGNARFRLVASGSYSAALNLTSNGTLTTSTSDVRLKTNIEPITDGLDKVMKLRGVRFNWKDDPDGSKKIGFIAQEVEKVVPELVFTNETDGYMGLNYAEMTAVLAEAVKEQQKIIGTQREQNAQLKKMLEELERRVAALESK